MEEVALRAGCTTTKNCPMLFQRRPFDCIDGVGTIRKHQPDFCFVVHLARKVISSTPSRTPTTRYLATRLISSNPSRHFRMVSGVFTPFLRRRAAFFAQGSEAFATSSSE